MLKNHKNKEIKKSIEVIPYSVDGRIVHQRREDGYINATALCKAHGKKFYEYRRLPTTESFLSELSKATGLYIDSQSSKRDNPASALIQSLRGGKIELQGTYIHPQLAIHLAQWLSPRFEIMVTRWVFDWMLSRAAEQFGGMKNLILAAEAWNRLRLICQPL